jgi:hypothetical protein
MKHFIIIILFLCQTVVTVKAQPSATDTALLNSYFDIKNALVNSDAHAAAEKASVFMRSVSSVGPGKLSADKVKAFKETQAKLAADAKKITASNDLAAQRIAFSSFSLNMYALVKTISLSIQPIYKDYCPMKQAYWLSKVSAIANPYFGKSMLTCGNITETIKPIIN